MIQSWLKLGTVSLQELTVFLHTTFTVIVPSAVSDRGHMQLPAAYHSLSTPYSLPMLFCDTFFI